MSENYSSSLSGTMKVLISLAVVALIALVGLGIWQHGRINLKDREISVLQGEKTGLVTARDSLSTYIGEVDGTIEEIGAKLRDVREKQVAISALVATAERDRSNRALILDDISAIEVQLAQDQRDIEDLKGRMSKSAFRIKSLEKMVVNLQNEIKLNQTAIAGLKSDLEAKELTLGVTRDSLSFSQKVLRSTENRLQETEQTLVDTRNTAWYVIGSAKELEKNNVIDRFGFFSRKPALTSEFDQAAFSRIDVTKISDFSVNCKAEDVQLVPPRAAGSYRVEKLERSKSVLKVLDRDEFWKVPYLAIVTR